MKASSAVMVQIQRQMTILGLPIPLLFIALGAGGFGAAACILLEWLPAVLPVAFGVFAACWYAFYRRSQANHHVDRDLLLTPRFWRASTERHLVTGGRR